MKTLAVKIFGAEKIILPLLFLFENYENDFCTKIRRIGNSKNIVHRERVGMEKMLVYVIVLWTVLGTMPVRSYGVDISGQQIGWTSRRYPAVPIPDPCSSPDCDAYVDYSIYAKVADDLRMAKKELAVAQEKIGILEGRIRDQATEISSLQFFKEENARLKNDLEFAERNVKLAEGRVEQLRTSDAATISALTEKNKILVKDIKSTDPIIAQLSELRTKLSQQTLDMSNLNLGITADRARIKELEDDNTIIKGELKSNAEAVRAAIEGLNLANEALNKLMIEAPKRRLLEIPSPAERAGNKTAQELNSIRAELTELNKTVAELQKEKDSKSKVLAVLITIISILLVRWIVRRLPIR
jgi:hypothetical protein